MEGTKGNERGEGEREGVERRKREEKEEQGERWRVAFGTLQG